MTKKDHQLIVDAFREASEKISKDNYFPFAQNAGICILGTILSQKLKEDNHNFNADKFYDDCRRIEVNKS